MTSELGIRRTDNLIIETHEAVSESQTLPRGGDAIGLKKEPVAFLSCPSPLKNTVDIPTYSC